MKIENKTDAPHSLSVRNDAQEDEDRIAVDNLLSRKPHMWDYRNLLREVINKDAQLPLGKYTYDALARRVRKISGDGASASATYYLLDGNREVQERTANGAISQEFTFGIYIDEPLTLDKNENADDSCIGTGDTRYFYQQNTLYSVYALTDADGCVREANFHDPYGRPYVITDGDDQDAVVNFNSNDSVAKGGSSTKGNPFLFTGRRRDEEVYGQYYYRARYLDWEMGCFIEKDPSVVIESLSQYQYVLGGPVFGLDAFGLFLGSGGDENKQSIIEPPFTLEEYIETKNPNTKKVCRECNIKIRVYCKYLEDPRAKFIGIKHCFFRIEEVKSAVSGGHRPLVAGAFAENPEKFKHGELKPGYNSKGDVEAINMAVNIIDVKYKEGFNACTFWDCLQKKMKETGWGKYDVIDNNSNTFIRHVLHKCGSETQIPLAAIGSKDDLKKYMKSKYFSEAFIDWAIEMTRQEGHRADRGSSEGAPKATADEKASS